MATKPTKLQQKGRDLLAEALLKVAEASRLDGRAPLDRMLFIELAARAARASSAYPLDEILARALEIRGLALGLSPSTAEMLTLADADAPPIDMVLMDDDAFRAVAAKMVEDLGDL